MQSLSYSMAANNGCFAGLTSFFAGCGTYGNSGVKPGVSLGWADVVTDVESLRAMLLLLLRQGRCEVQASEYGEPAWQVQFHVWGLPCTTLSSTTELHAQQCLGKSSRAKWLWWVVIVVVAVSSELCSC